MASITAPSYSRLLSCRGRSFLGDNHLTTRRASSRTRSRTSRLCIVFASQGRETRRQWQRPPPGVDTRIHWDDPDEGWVGGSSEQKKSLEEEQKNFMSDKFEDLINSSSDSHYQFLGVSAEADIEEIKAAYRRLTKEYHPDTTSLPLKTALENFMRLKQVYEVLTNEEKRRFYDWSLAQEAASRRTEKLRKKLEDPFVQDFKNYKSVPDMVDRLGGKNIELGDQATAALTIDIFIIIFSICCIIYVVFFKEQ